MAHSLWGRGGCSGLGEWEFGGLPAWLIADGPIKLRTNAEPYMTHATTWWREGLFPAVKPLLYSNGGPIVMVQVENEYGSYGDVSSNPDDLAYLKGLIDVARDSLGDDVILFTTDGGDTGYMTRGSIKGGYKGASALAQGCTDRPSAKANAKLGGEIALRH